MWPLPYLDTAAAGVDVITVNLNGADREWAAKIGKIRWIKSKDKKSRFKGAKEDDHIVGAAGELAFCRALGLPWPAYYDTFHELPDVHPFWEIRTARPHGLKGIKVAKEDPDHELVVWVRGKMPSFEVMGYLRVGGIKMHPEWHGDPGKKKRPIWLAPPTKMIEIDRFTHEGCKYLRARHEVTTVVLPDATLGMRWVPDESSDVWICFVCGRRLE